MRSGSSFVSGRILCGVALSMLLAAVAAAQSQLRSTDSATAAAVGAAFLGAVTESRWSEAARFLDLVQLDSLRRERAAYERFRRTAPAMTLGQLMRSNPEMPRSVAAYQVKQMTKERKRMNFVRFEFGLSDPDSLLALPIELVAQRWIEVHDQRWQNRELHRDCRGARSDELPPPTYHVLSTTVEGDLAYLLFVDTFWQSRVGFYAPPPRVMQLRRREEHWVILPRGDLIGLPEMVNACG